MKNIPSKSCEQQLALGVGEVHRLKKAIVHAARRLALRDAEQRQRGVGSGNKSSLQVAVCQLARGGGSSALEVKKG